MEINLNSKPFIDIFKTALQASIKAGVIIMDVYSGHFNAETKEDGSPITIADKLSNQCIISFLENTGLPVLSEESLIKEYNERKHWEYFWMIDPIDGTKEFINKNGEFTINIALIEKDTPVAGIVYAPAINKLYFGIKNEGSFLYNSIGLKTSNYNDITILMLIENSKQLLPQNTTNDKYYIATSKSHFNSHTNEFIEALREKSPDVKLIPVGSSLKFCLLCDGSCNLYPRFGKTFEWDTAAGQAILDAYGGIAIDLKTNQPLKYNKQNLENQHFIAFPHINMSERFFENFSL